MKMGLHVRIENSLLKTLKSYRLKVIQFFIKDISSDKTLDEAVKYISKKGIICIIHSSYTINMAIEFDKTNLPVRMLLNEMKIAEKLNIPYIVIHTGKQLALTSAQASNNMYMSLMYVLGQTNNILILLETPAGQGTEMLSSIEDFARFYSKFKNNRIKICIDTCHIFAAGYDILEYLTKFKSLIGIEELGLVHYNDSMEPQGSRKDRHARPGEGHIGKNKLRKFIEQIPSHIPIVLEN